MHSASRSHSQIGSIHSSEIIVGEGQPLLMLHGWGASAELMLPLAQKLIGHGFQIYAPDLPGFGESEAPPQAWSVFDYAQWVITYMDAHQLERTYLFGHSFGGRLGLILGAEHPQRLYKMALANSAGIVHPAPLARRLRQGTYRALRRTLENAGARSFAKRLRAAYNARYGSADFNATSGVMRDSFIRIINQDLRSYAQRVQVSTLLFWGDQDEDTPLADGRLLEQLIPDAGLVVYPGAGHYSYIEQADNVARVMHHFFTQAAPST